MVNLTRTFFVAAFALPLTLASVCANARTIKSVTISKTGINMNPKEEWLNNACKKFRPTARQVKNYFQKAYSVPRTYGTNDRYAPCVASGTIVFSDLGKAEWAISSGGAGSLTWNEDDHVYLFYKNNKWFDPTACSYGAGNEGNC
ncbi:hypothetical protein QTI33_04895 [Variovorax sp. J22P271]|uniref:hypothetical protein n=1 Tax=Variovorax davisae TaxID=3053515 RepID=UPI002576C42B|nr:hypothetical protein [Variovorax sp. J22P271]MDM0031475.1 hypothetical protein [Variovorax sp. J22P271]